MKVFITCEQRLENGNPYHTVQEEIPDDWLAFGNPWEVARPEYVIPVHFYGEHCIVSSCMYCIDNVSGEVKWLDGGKFEWTGSQV